MKKLKKTLIITFVSIFSLLLVLSLAFILYVSSYYKAVDMDDYLKSSDKVSVVETKDYYAFIPNNYDYNYGYIFYPGGKVEEEAYAEYMYDIASDGIASFIVKMPCRLAVFNINGANDVIDDYKDIKNFYIGGHSLGGAMASSYLYKNYSKYKGLILEGAYSTKDLSEFNLNIISFKASLDLVLNEEKYNKYKSNLGTNIQEVIIDGGIHSYFGSYGHQKKDGDATITYKEQKDIIVNNIVSFIKK